MVELLYGRNAVLEAVRANRRKIHRVLMAEGSKEGDSLRQMQQAAEKHRIPVVRVARQELDRRLQSTNHQGVALEAGPFPYSTLDEALAAAYEAGEPPLLLLLDHLQDPQNIGTLIRTADVVGVHAIVLPDRRSASITPAVVNASAGAVEHLRVIEVPNLAQTIALLKEKNVWVAGLEDDPNAQDYDALDLRGPLALVVGAEGPGLARLVRERCDFLVRLPMRGHVASLNAATAGSILLYHAWRQRR